MATTTLAMVLAGGQGSRLGVLCRWRPKPVLPFLGKRRVIDFALENARASGLGRVAVLVDHLRQALFERLRPACDLDFLEPPGRGYLGTASAVYENLDYVRRQRSAVVLILAADHVYRMDYRPFIEAHRAGGAGLTVALTDVAPDEAGEYGIATLGEAGLIEHFEEKPEHPQSTLASMGVYAFDPAYLEELLDRDALDPRCRHDFGRSILPLAVRERQARGYRFGGYWRDIGTVRSYYQAHMECLDRPELLLQLGLREPGDWHSNLTASASYVHPSAAVQGTVDRSVIGPAVVVEKGALVRNSILLGPCRVGRRAVVESAILDEGVLIEAGAAIGATVGCAQGGGGITVVGGLPSACRAERSPCPTLNARLVGRGVEPIIGKAVANLTAMPFREEDHAARGRGQEDSVQAVGGLGAPRRAGH